jgi:hypothetical protein
MIGRLLEQNRNESSHPFGSDRLNRLAPEALVDARKPRLQRRRPLLSRILKI